MADVDAYPPSMICPITHVVMEDAVMDPEGNSYSRAAIETWLDGNTTSPVRCSTVYAATLLLRCTA